MNAENRLEFVDLFCGIGGFRVAAETVCREREILSRCVFSCDIDTEARRVYEANFNEEPRGDVTQIASGEIPAHDVLFAGFPCQPFSICGDRKGFEDSRGTLFFDIARIIEARKPRAFMLENVKMLVGHGNGRTLAYILEVLRGFGYQVEYKVLNALNFGLPQKRERVFIVGFSEPCDFAFPNIRLPMKSLAEILEADVPQSYFASERIRSNRVRSYTGKNFDEPTVWHENKGGHISAYPYSCALRAGASYNYLLVNGERRLTEREMLRLQGFPDSYKIVCSYGETRKQAGNSVAVPVVAAVIHAVLNTLEGKTQIVSSHNQVVRPQLAFEETGELASVA
ncbi:MAG: DNA (cytosine-5-)-methyltransferase [Pyrinomonadaceae bacterium MAG19_C2-C3]|nr:DNA (cytosine-5-)-methyltransferase [Pyrinomonadaceae bacterium MAG19_C2-C3]